jgi:HAD superfamily hydrolase (TIGR01509 family)
MSALPSCMIKAIIFDFTNVIYKTDWKGVNRHFYKNVGFDIVIKPHQWNDELLRIYNQSDIGKEDFKKFFLELNPNIKDINKITRFYKEAYSKNKIINLRLLKLIKKLRMQYIILGFTDVKKIHYLANKEIGLYNGFTKVFTSFEFGKTKSEASVFQILSKKLIKFKVKPCECIFIDDNPINIKNAEQANFKVILYADFPKTRKLRKEILEISKK